MKYRILGKSGLRVSELGLGTITFGTEWGWGAEKNECKKMFNAFTKAGGNFIDTANRYTEGTSEKFVGEFIKEERHHFVLATKYTLHDKLGDPNFSGNHRKNMMRSVHESLKRLDTEYIDIFWVHAWDFLTPVQEVMRGLDDLVSSGKIHYIGISDTPAWIVARANTMAELRGWSQFVGLQVEYNLLQRDAERELIPMAKELGLALTPYAPLAGGVLTGKYLKAKNEKIELENNFRSEKNNEIVKKVVEIAKELGALPSQIALQWIMQKDYISIPIISGKKTNHIAESLKATEMEVPSEFMQELDEISQIELGSPHDFLKSENAKTVVYGATFNKIKM